MKQITITVYRSELCLIKVWSSKIHPTKYSPFITAGDQLENLQFFVVYFFIQNHKAVSSIQFSNSDVFGFTNKSEDINPVLYFLKEHKDAPMTFKTSLYYIERSCSKIKSHRLLVPCFPFLAWEFSVCSALQTPLPGLEKLSQVYWRPEIQFIKKLMLMSEAVTWRL